VAAGQDYGPIPPHLRDAVLAFETALSDTRTRLARLREVEIPDIDGPSPEQMAAAATRPDAPRELKEVARAVEEGRTTWADAARGRLDGAPEVRALVANGGPRFVEMWERGQEEDRRRSQTRPADGR
jgi:hypothetical protein